MRLRHRLRRLIRKSRAAGQSDTDQPVYGVIPGRASRQTRRVRTWVWCDTEDNIANGLTKLNADGTLPAEQMQALLRDAFWEPEKVYRWGGLLTSPSRPVHRPCIVTTRPTTTTTTTTTTDDNHKTDSNKTTKTKVTGPMPTVYATLPRIHMPRQPAVQFQSETLLAYDWASDSDG